MMEDPLELMRKAEHKSVRPGERQALERKAVSACVKENMELAASLCDLRRAGQPPNLVWLGSQLGLTLRLQRNLSPLALTRVLSPGKFAKSYLWKELLQLYTETDGGCGIVFQLPAWCQYMVALLGYDGGHGTRLLHTMAIEGLGERLVTIMPLEQLARHA